MAGDGVNAALAQAELGLATGAGTGTDVAIDASICVLADRISVQAAVSPRPSG